MGRFTTLLVAVLIAGLAAPVAAGASRSDDRDERPDHGREEREHDIVDLRFLTFSDWHGQIDPLFVFGQGTFGGAAELSAYFRAEEADNPNTLIFTAGDAYGASPPLSSFFGEEPAVRSMRMMGVDADGLGNHNFDRGIAPLQGLIDIARSRSANEPGDPFVYVSANLKNRRNQLKHVKDYKIFEIDDVKVAVIGVINPEAPTLVFPGSFGDLRITDPVKAANRARREAKRRGADVFVLLAHMGVTDFDASGAPMGPLVDLANGVRGFDVIVGDHTNVEFAGEINGALVVENRSKGRTYARVDVQVEERRKHRFRVTDRSAAFVEPVSSAVTPDPDIVSFLEPLRAQLNAILGTVIGQSTVFIPRADECGQSSGRTCESLVGDVVTDALRDRYGTDFAITNSGGLRADLTCPTTDDPNDLCPAPDGGDFEITAGQVLTVLPFGNSAVTLSVTGDELKQHLEQGVSAMPGVSGRFAQVSGLCFTYDIDAPVGSRVLSAVFQNADGTCSATAVDLTAASTYTLAENDFMASGGDGYPNLISRAVTRDLLDQVVSDYIAANTPITPTIDGRITCTASAGGTCPAPLP